MVNRVNRSYLDAGVMPVIKGVIIHNDAGSVNATPEFYESWLAGRNPVLGIAHYYIDRNTILRVVDTNRIAYHAGDGLGEGNSCHIGYEVCQSMGASDADFIANEDMTLMQATEDLLFYGLSIGWDTVRLHHEFAPTSCPHRSMALHGGTNESVRRYFIERMQYFASLGSTVDEMLANYYPDNEARQVNSLVDVLDVNVVLDNREVPYYKGRVKEDYFVESDSDVGSQDKELLKKDTEVWVYEKRNGMSRINSHLADQWVEDDYIYECVVC